MTYRFGATSEKPTGRLEGLGQKGSSAAHGDIMRARTPKAAERRGAKGPRKRSGGAGLGAPATKEDLLDTHVKVLAWLHIVFGILGSLIGLGLMALLGIIGVAGAASDPDAWMALPILGLTGAALGMFILALSLPGIIAGIGLLKYQPWARILTIVLSALNLMNFPIGTILGIYGLWVMLSDEGSRLFARPSVST
jgi:hypothetical protein